MQNNEPVLGYQLARSAAELSKFSAVELLRDGRSIEIRALSPDDRADLVAAVGRTSARSLYRRSTSF